MGIEVNGEIIDRTEALSVLRTLYNDAKQIAGEFHGMNRSVKFRTNWPNEYDFAEANWKSFVQAARSMYAARLGDPMTPPAEARQMHMALVLEAQIARGQETDNRLQLSPGTQQFEGDKIENSKIIEQFGTKPNFRAAVMNGAAKFGKLIEQG